MASIEHNYVKAIVDLMRQIEEQHDSGKLNIERWAAIEYDLTHVSRAEFIHEPGNPLSDAWEKIRAAYQKVLNWIHDCVQFGFATVAEFVGWARKNQDFLEWVSLAAAGASRHGGPTGWLASILARIAAELAVI